MADTKTGWIVALEPGEPAERITAKAAAVAPHPRQLAWQQQEQIAFLHFGVNTFTGMEWGSGLEDPAIFQPDALDAAAWVAVLAECGFRSVVLTAKHHDGFCLWPSRYTDFSVRASPWRDGRGDVMRDLADAARASGLRVGVYLSPADLHEMEAPGGRYGNGSPLVKTIIPTLLPGDERAPAQTFSFIVDDYNRYYLNQLYELLTDYGPVHEVWFDGANPKPGVAEVYDYPAWFSLVRALAPDAVMFNGPDLRWVGNESGLARESEWSVLPFHGDATTGLRPLDPQQADLGSRERLLAGGDYLAWYPAEVDVSIRPGWFYHAEEDEKVKSVAELLEIYEQSVGRNGLLLLNVPPDRHGQLAAVDVTRLREFSAALARIYGTNLARGGTASGESAAAHSAGSLLDGNPESWWSPPGAETTGAVVIDLPAPFAFDRVAVEEFLPAGQHVEAFAVDVWRDGTWQEVATGTTIGYRRILRVPRAQASRLRLRIVSARGLPALRGFALHDSGSGG